MNVTSADTTGGNPDTNFPRAGLGGVDVRVGELTGRRQKQRFHGGFPETGDGLGWSEEKSRGVEKPEKITAPGAAESQGIPPTDETKPAAPKTGPAEPSNTLPGK